MKKIIKKRHFSLQKGFTLIELVIYMGILSILMSVLTGLFGAIIDVQLESESRSSVDQDGRYILSRLAHDMRSADAIVIPANPGDLPSDTLQITINSVDYIYSLDFGGNLQVENNLGITLLNSFDTQVSDLTFTRIGTGGSNDTVRIDYTITSEIQRPSGPESQSFQTTLGLQ